MEVAAEAELDSEARDTTSRPYAGGCDWLKRCPTCRIGSLPCPGRRWGHQPRGRQRHFRGRRRRSGRCAGVPGRPGMSRRLSVSLLPTLLPPTSKLTVCALICPYARRNDPHLLGDASRPQLPLRVPGHRQTRTTIRMPIFHSCAPGTALSLHCPSPRARCDAARGAPMAPARLPDRGGPRNAAAGAEGVY